MGSWVCDVDVYARARRSRGQKMGCGAVEVKGRYVWMYFFEEIVVVAEEEIRFRRYDLKTSSRKPWERKIEIAFGIYEIGRKSHFRTSAALLIVLSKVALDQKAGTSNILLTRDRARVAQQSNVNRAYEVGGVDIGVFQARPCLVHPL